MNKFKNSQEMILAWVALEHGDGFYINQKIVLLNMRKLLFQAQKQSPLSVDNATVTNCHFIGSRKAAKRYGLLKEFDLMIYRDKYSFISE